MANHLLILSDEFLARVHVGLGEIQSKFAIPVIQEIENQINAFSADEKQFLDSVKSHIAALEAKFAPAPDAVAAKDEV